MAIENPRVKILHCFRFYVTAIIVDEARLIEFGRELQRLREGRSVHAHHPFNGVHQVSKRMV